MILPPRFGNQHPAIFFFFPVPIPQGSSGTNPEEDSPVSPLPSPAPQESVVASRLFEKQGVTLGVLLLLLTVGGVSSNSTQ